MNKRADCVGVKDDVIAQCGRSPVNSTLPRHAALTTPFMDIVLHDSTQKDAAFIPRKD